jgi:hypothetical protein
MANVFTKAFLQTATLAEQLSNCLIIAPNVNRNPKSSGLLQPTHECSAIIDIVLLL